MKNIFAVNLTENQENNVFDGARYVTARVDGDQERVMDRASAALAQAVEAGRLPKPLRICKSLLGWAAGICLLALGTLAENVPLSRLPAYAPVCSTAAAVCSLLWIALWLAARRRVRRNPTSLAYREALARCRQVWEKSLKQLGVPPDAPKIDLIMYSYVQKRGKESINTPLINIVGYVFLKEDCLCLTNACWKVSLPLEKITGLRREKHRLCVAFWNKEVPFNRGIYKPYRITMNQMGMIFFKPYYVLTLQEYGETFELAIAPYDLKTVREVLSQGFQGTFDLPLQE